MKIQYGFYVDTTKCTGCKTCHVICKERMLKDPYAGDQDIKPRRVYEIGGGQWQVDADGTYNVSDVHSYYVPVSCNHCSSPACVKACPTGACYKRGKDGLVLIDSALCIGCESCARACPYDAPQMDKQRGVMMKCDGCHDRLEAGKNPICVDSCPLRALDFGPIDKLREKYGDNANIHPMPNSRITNPNWVIKLNRHANKGGEILNSFEV